MDPTPPASGKSLQDTSPPVDPADLPAVILRHGAIIHTYQEQAVALQAANEQLWQPQPIPVTIPPLAIAAPRTELPRMAFPDKFDGYISTVASQVIKYLHARQNLPLLSSGENCVIPCLSLPAKIHYAHEC